MLQNDIRIRIDSEASAFIYSIVRAGVVIDSAAVPVVPEEVEDPVTPGYYGGSEVLD